MNYRTINKTNPFFSIDYDVALLFGGEADGYEMVVNKGTDFIQMNTVDPSYRPEPGNVLGTPLAMFRKIEYRRRTGTRLFYRAQ
jgi:hypothetical protein